MIIKLLNGDILYKYIKGAQIVTDEKFIAIRYKDGRRDYIPICNIKEVQMTEQKKHYCCE